MPTKWLKTIHKYFVRAYLDYGDTIYDQAFNVSFHRKLELLQYNAAPGITGATWETSKEKV